MEGVWWALSVVQYAVDDQTVVRFEFDPPAGFRPVGSDEIAGRVRDAVAPAVEAARVVLDRVRQARPNEVKLKFGIKVSGAANWLIAKAASEANFEIELTWRPSDAEQSSTPSAEQLAAERHAAPQSPTSVRP